MIVVVGANGIAAWMMRSRRGLDRQLVCLNDQFVITLSVGAPKNPRQLLVNMLTHSETLNGRTLSVGEVSELT